MSQCTNWHAVDETTCHLYVKALKQLRPTNTCMCQCLPSSHTRLSSHIDVLLLEHPETLYYHYIVFCVCFITKSFLTYSFFPPTPALSTISRPLLSSMCSITPETYPMSAVAISACNHS